MLDSGGHNAAATVTRWLNVRRAEAVDVTATGASPPAMPGPVEVEGALIAREVIPAEGAIRTLRLHDIVARWAPLLPARARRNTPVVLGFCRSYEQTLRLTLPPGLVVDSLPEPVHVNAGPISYSLAWRRDNGAIVADRKLALTSPLVPPADYVALKGALDTLLAAESRPVLMHVGAQPSAP